MEIFSFQPTHYVPVQATRRAKTNLMRSSTSGRLMDKVPVKRFYQMPQVRSCQSWEWRLGGGRERTSRGLRGPMAGMQRGRHPDTFRGCSPQANHPSPPSQHCTAEHSKKKSTRESKPCNSYYTYTRRECREKMTLQVPREAQWGSEQSPESTYGKTEKLFKNSNTETIKMSRSTKNNVINTNIL